MPNAEQFFAEKLCYFTGLAGEPGSGKTRQAVTFPKFYGISIGDSYGIKTVLDDPLNKQFRNNLVWHEGLDLAVKSEAKEIFRITEDPKQRTSLYGCLAHVRELKKDNAIESVILDGMSFLSDFKGAELSKPGASSDGDKWAYYRQLKADLIWLTNTAIMPLVSRHGLNVVLTMHIQRQDDDTKAKQASQDVDLQPRIEGSYRTALSGIPRAMIYLHQHLETKGTETVLKYLAFCSKTKASRLGVIPAKNDYGLPPMIDVTGKNLYDLLVQSMTAAAPRLQAVKK